MSERVLIPLPGIGTLALDGETYRAALAEGAERTGAPAPSAAVTDAEPLLDAEQAAARLNITARWLEDSARAGIIPHHKFGRFIRFRVSELAAHSRVEGASTDSQSVARFRGQLHQ